MPAVFCIDIESIDSKYEKMNVIDRLYTIEQLVNEWREKMEAFPHLKQRYGGRVEEIYRQLVDLRTKTLGKDITKKQYGVFAKYPVGYEG